MNTSRSSSAALSLQRALNVRPEEWPGLLFLYALALVLLTGITWGETMVVAAFLQRVGVGFLPWAFVVSALASIAGLFVYAGFSDRIADRPLFVGLLGLSIAGVILGLALLWTGAQVPGYLILYLVLNVGLTDAFNVHWASYVNGFYDTRAAKRIVPVLSTATRISGIAAGLTMPLLNRFFSPAVVIALWLLSLAVAGVMIWLQPRRFPAATTASPGREARVRARVSYAENLREGYSYVSASPFLRMLAFSTLLVAVWIAIVNYRVSSIFVDSLQTTTAIADFTGLLTAVANIVALPIQLLLLSRLIGRAGLGNASLIFPAGAAVVSAGLFAAPGLAMASLAFIARTTFRTAFRNPVESLLYNAVPRRVKGRARAFIGGLVAPLGALAGGLLLFAPIARNPVVLSALIVIVSGGIVLTAFAVRRQYARALVSMLEQEDYSPLTPQSLDVAGDLNIADPATVRALKSKLETSDSPEMTLFLARLYADAAGKQAGSTLAAIARRTGDDRLRAALMDVLAASGVQDDAARALYSDLLDDPHPSVRRSALSGLSQTPQWVDDVQAPRLAVMLQDPDIDVREAAIAALLRAADGNGFSSGTDAANSSVKALTGLLQDPDPAARVNGIRILGATWGDAALPRLLAFARDPADEVRLEVGLVLESLAGIALQEDAQVGMLETARDLLRDPVERVRQSGATVLSQSVRGASGRSAQEALLEALADPSPAVRKVAVDGVAACGRASIALVHPRLNSPDPQVRRAAAMILARVEPRQYTALVESHLSGDLLTIYRNLGLADALRPWQEQPAIAVLRDALTEQSYVLRDGLFELLATVQDAAAVALVRESCCSPSESVRANAAETLEAMTSPRIASLVTPLYDPEATAQSLVAAGEEAWAFRFRSADAALEELLKPNSLLTQPDAWLRSLAAYSINEMARESQPPGIAVETDATAAGFPGQEDFVLSVIDKIILMKEVPFFQGMTIEQLRVLASVCEEQFFPAGTVIVKAGDPGGVLYVIGDGRVALEQEKRPGSTARLATLGAHNYFGEINLFDGSPHQAAAITLQDTQSLRLRKEPLIALARQHPELSLALIHVLSQRLRDANDRIAELTRSKPKELHRLYDALN